MASNWIIGTYYTDSLPEHWIIERKDGSLWLRPATIINPHLHDKPYLGHRAGLKAAHTTPIQSVYGITASSLVPRSDQQARA